MAQLTTSQFQQIFNIAADACGGSSTARVAALQFNSELTRGEWDIPSFFIRLEELLAPLNDRIPVFRIVAGREVFVGNFRYRDAMALICARLMVHRGGEYEIPDPNVLRPLMSMFSLGWELITINDILIEHVSNRPAVVLPPRELPARARELPARAREPPARAREPPARAVSLPEIRIPEGQEDAITFASIPDGTRMVDFHGERARHRYYTEETYDSLNPKKNPFNRKDILPGDVTRYTAKLDSTMKVQEAGRRKTRKSKRRAKKTRRHK
jgi:hypothetical protein